MSENMCISGKRIAHTHTHSIYYKQHVVYAYCWFFGTRQSFTTTWSSMTSIKCIPRFLFQLCVDFCTIAMFIENIANWQKFGRIKTTAATATNRAQGMECFSSVSLEIWIKSNREIIKEGTYNKYKFAMPEIRPEVFLSLCVCADDISLLCNERGDKSESKREIDRCRKSQKKKEWIRARSFICLNFFVNENNKNNISEYLAENMYFCFGWMFIIGYAEHNFMLNKMQTHWHN